MFVKSAILLTIKRNWLRSVNHEGTLITTEQSLRNP